MADMPSDFWSGWIILMTVISAAGLLWLVLSIYMQPSSASHDNEPVWDEDLREGDSAPPLWWFWMILAAMVFSVVYLMLYPGMGSYAGAFRWSQQSQLTTNNALFNVDFAAERERYGAMSLDALAMDAGAMDAAARLFKDNCSACHGVAADGQALAFPDLRDDDWLWGGDVERIEQSIRLGRNAVMVAWGPVLGEEGVSNVAGYVATLANGGDESHAGRQQYMQFCVACHGASGEGNALLGAPRLSDDIWLYGGDAETVRTTIAAGRNGQMPAFQDRLDDLQIKLIMAWLLQP